MPDPAILLLQAACTYAGVLNGIGLGWQSIGRKCRGHEEDDRLIPGDKHPWTAMTG
jgi:hypothetical protein